MSERESILARVREALAATAPKPSHGEARAPGDPVAPRAGEARQWLPAVGEGFDARVNLFRENSVKLKTDFQLLESREALEKCLMELRDSEGWKRIGAHNGELVQDICRGLNLPLCLTDQAYQAEELERCDAGITECDALIAQTGSVLVTSRSAGGRALSVLPPHHVVLARGQQLIADLPEAFALLKDKYGTNYPSFISFITGPSRTGDIERILVLGAHGPKKLTVLCMR